MSLPVVFHPLAERELNGAAAYYGAQERAGLVEAFLGELDRVTHLLSAQPQAGTPIRGELRQWRLRRFPYSVIYRVCVDHIRILAIAAHKQRPLYWQRRT